MDSTPKPLTSAFLISTKQHVSQTAFCHKISEHIGSNCHIRSDFHGNMGASLLFIDTSAIGIAHCFNILKRADQQHVTPACIIFNVPNQPLALKLIEWPHVIGAFTTEDSPELLLQQLPKLLNNQLWISSTLSNRLLKIIRKKPRQTHITPRDIKLTKREKQILLHLKDGHTNQAIADLLFVSEHTIKSHLYSAYKKIGISTRLEASNWVMDNIENLLN